MTSLTDIMEVGDCLRTVLNGAATIGDDRAGSRSDASSECCFDRSIRRVGRQVRKYAGHLLKVRQDQLICRGEATLDRKYNRALDSMLWQFLQRPGNYAMAPAHHILRQTFQKSVSFRGLMS